MGGKDPIPLQHKPPPYTAHSLFHTTRPLSPLAPSISLNKDPNLPYLGVLQPGPAITRPDVGSARTTARTLVFPPIQLLESLASVVVSYSTLHSILPSLLPRQPNTKLLFTSKPSPTRRGRTAAITDRSPDYAKAPASLGISQHLASQILALSWISFPLVPASPHAQLCPIPPRPPIIPISSTPP